jgi:SAM-dependent methyltransferase
MARRKGARAERATFDRMNDETPRSPGEAARLAQRTVWAAAARGWIEDREALLAGMTPVTARLIELAAIAPGQAVLDIASGSGDPAFSIASVVGPAGRVDGFDLVPEMVAGAQAIARARATENVTFRAVASELDIGGADITYDAITCRFGLMFMPDPAAALRTWRSSLRPGGRIALSTWAEFPVLRVVRDVVARRAPVPDVDPSAPGILALPTPDRLRAVLEQAGYEDVAVETLELPLFDDLPQTSGGI